MGERGRWSGDGGDEARFNDALDRMEPDLKLLEGIVSILKSLSETSDAVEPAALEALAHLAGGTVGRLAGSWREAADAARR